MSMQSLKKIGQKLLKLESGNEAQTDGHANSSEGNTIPRHFVWRGIKKVYDDPAYVTLRPFAYIFLQLGKMGQKHEVKKKKKTWA